MHLEQHGGERALRLIAVRSLKATDPILAGVLAFHAPTAGRHGVALDRFPGKRLAHGDPILSVPCSKSRFRGSPSKPRQFAGGHGLNFTFIGRVRVVGGVNDGPSWCQSKGHWRSGNRKTHGVFSGWERSDGVYLPMRQTTTLTDAA